MSSNSTPPRGLSPDDQLPPVEPPSAGFIVQLFVVPGVIVIVVVMIWLMFNWLAHMGNDRDAFVRALARNNEGRWQAAFNLANALRAERKASDPKLITDPELAKQLADILAKEIEAGSMENNPVALRIYLCRALGEFRVPDGLPVLIKGASTERDPREGDVRRAAIEGIALLAANGQAEAFANNPALAEVLLKAAEDAEPRTRSVAAMALGVIGGPKFLDKLHVLIDDSNPDVRYNAAVRLAHLGDVAAIPVLVEMLDQEEQAGVQTEQQAEMRPFKRAVITVNALRAVNQLAEKSPTANLSELKTAVDKLLAAEVPPDIRIEATATQAVLSGRAAPAQ